MLAGYLCCLSLATGMQSLLPGKKGTSVGDGPLEYIDVDPNNFIHFDALNDRASLGCIGIDPDCFITFDELTGVSSTVEAKYRPANLPSAIAIFCELQLAFERDHCPAIRKFRSYISRKLKSAIVSTKSLAEKLLGLDLMLALVHMQEQLLKSIYSCLCAPECCHIYELSALFMWEGNQRKIVRMIGTFPVEDMELDNKVLAELRLGVAQTGSEISLLFWKFVVAFKKAIISADPGYFAVAQDSREIFLSLSLVCQEQPVLRICTNSDDQRDIESIRNQIGTYLGTLKSHYCGRIRVAMKKFDGLKVEPSAAVEELFSELDKDPRNRAIFAPEMPEKSGTKASRKSKKLQAEVKTAQTVAIEKEEEAAELERPINCPKYSEEVSDESDSEQKALSAEHSHRGDLATKEEAKNFAYYYEAEEKEEGGSKQEEGEEKVEGSSDKEKVGGGTPSRYRVSAAQVARFLVRGGIAGHASMKDMQKSLMNEAFGIDAKFQTPTEDIKMMMHYHKAHQSKQLRKLSGIQEDTEAWKQQSDVSENKQN